MLVYFWAKIHKIFEWSNRQKTTEKTEKFNMRRHCLLDILFHDRKNSHTVASWCLTWYKNLHSFLHGCIFKM